MLQVELIGVAGVDVPLPLFKSHIPFQLVSITRGWQEILKLCGVVG